MRDDAFTSIWKRIKSLEGESFKTRRGLEFTYEISDDVLYPSRTSYRISQSEFQKAYDLMPIKGPGEISQLVRGPSYVWAILHDPRIRTTD
jgi:hypothetical protein